MKINHTNWKSLTLAVTVSLMMGGVALAATPIIDSLDVIATMRHFLVVGTPLSGCNLVAADVASPFNGDPNTIDILAIQKYYLGMTSGIGLTGTTGGCDLYGNTRLP